MLLFGIIKNASEQKLNKITNSKLLFLSRYIQNPKIDIAFHNVLISAFWGFFSESDTDIQSASAGELLYPIGICA
jgi:hypothetical protein